MRNLYAGLMIAGAILCAPSPATAQTEPVKIAGLVELSGAGALAGTNFDNGVKLAVKEINAAGGILGRKIDYTAMDIKSDPDLTKTLAQQVVAMRPYAVMGPVFSDLTLASMDVLQRAEIPSFTGSEASEITLQGDPYIFRTSFTQAAAMPRVARYLKNAGRAKSIAIVWVNNAFGRGGREALTKALASEGIKVVADISTESQQSDFVSAVEAVKQSGADTVFVYLNEVESARFLVELRKQNFIGSVVGESTLMGQQVIDLAGEAANEVIGHVGLTPHALIKSVRRFDNAYVKEYKRRSDHNGMKGYIAVYVVKAVTEKIGKFDSKALAAAMKGAALSAKEYPGILLDIRYDEKGDLDRASFIVRVKGGRHEFLATLPPAGASAAVPAAGKK